MLALPDRPQSADARPHTTLATVDELLEGFVNLTGARYAWLSKLMAQPLALESVRSAMSTDHGRCRLSPTEFDIRPQVEEQDELVQHSRLLAVLYSSDDRRDALLSAMQQARHRCG